MMEKLRRKIDDWLGSVTPRGVLPIYGANREHNMAEPLRDLRTRLTCDPLDVLQG